MKRASFLLSIFCLALLLDGCVAFRATGMAYFPGQSDFEVVGHFRRSCVVQEFFGTPAGGNLFNFSAYSSDDELRKILSEEVEKFGGDGAINIRVDFETKWWHSLLNKITARVYAPAKLTVEGDVVRRP